MVCSAFVCNDVVCFALPVLVLCVGSMCRMPVLVRRVGFICWYSVLVFCAGVLCCRSVLICRALLRCLHWFALLCGHEAHGARGAQSSNVLRLPCEALLCCALLCAVGSCCALRWSGFKSMARLCFAVTRLTGARSVAFIYKSMQVYKCRYV